MHPRLEEIRKRFLTQPVPPVPSAPPRYISLKRAGESFSPIANHSQERVTDSEVMLTTEENPGPLNSSHADPPIEPAIATEPTLEAVDEQLARHIPKSPDGLARAVVELFEPARQCQEHLLEITQVSAAIRNLTRVAVELRESLKSFHGHLRKLSRCFESMSTFRDELGVLAESFAPVRALHQQVVQLAETVRTHLAEVAHGLEPAKALQVVILDLALAVDSVSELQAQFYALSKAFGDATDSRVASTEPTKDCFA